MNFLGYSYISMTSYHDCHAKIVTIVLFPQLEAL